MNPVEIEIGNARELFNNLFRSSDPADLTQSLFAARCPTGVIIDVSWYPEHDPNGRYTITAFRETWDKREKEIELDDLDDVIEAVERLIQEFSEQVSYSSDAESEETVWVPDQDLCGESKFALVP